MNIAIAQPWVHSSYQSGTVTVSSDLFGRPHYGIGYSGQPMDEIECDRIRAAIGAGLALWLNGGCEFPGILRGGTRLTPECIRLANGFEIEARGPLYDAEPPHLLWRTRDDADSKIARWEIIEAVWRQQRP